MKLEELFDSIANSTETMKKCIAEYVAVRKMISDSKRDKKEKTKLFNENDDRLKIVCDAYLNIMLSKLPYDFTIDCRLIDGTNCKRNFQTWFQHIPASTKFHDTENGGLLIHCKKLFYNWTKTALQMNVDYPVERMCFVAITHDFCKTTHYAFDEANNVWINNYPETTHHATKSLQIIKDMGIDVSADIEALILMHMSGFQNEEDKLAMSLDARNWLFNLNSIQILQLLNNADCK